MCMEPVAILELRGPQITNGLAAAAIGLDCRPPPKWPNLFWFGCSTFICPLISVSLADVGLCSHHSNTPFKCNQVGLFVAQLSLLIARNKPSKCRSSSSWSYCQCLALIGKSIGPPEFGFAFDSARRFVFFNLNPPCFCVPDLWLLHIAFLMSCWNSRVDFNSQTMQRRKRGFDYPRW